MTGAKGLVLVVEDERPIADLERMYLTREGFGVHVEYDGDAGLAAARRLKPVAIVLDVGLPGIDGTEICRRLRAADDWTPIVFVTARDEEVERVLGLELGADDYLVKPFEFPELVARLRALQRRSGHRAPPELRFGQLRLDPFTHQAYRADTLLGLSPKEFRILEQLLRAQGGVLSAETLLQRAWDENADPFTNSPRVVISTLRKKLGKPWPIETVPGAGYRVVRT
jgi:two-component system response regulator VanR